MVTYNPKDWFTQIIQFHKSDTFRQLFFSLLCIGLYSAAIVYIEAHYFSIDIENPTVMHSILGLFLSMLFVFRTNSAYDRWWEGRKIWGSTVNNSRNISLKLSAIITDKKNRRELKDLITNYVYGFKKHLREKDIPEEFIPTESMSLTDFSTANHKPNIIAKALHAKIHELHLNKQLTNEHLIILNEELKSFTNNCGVCERIKNMPTPYSYDIFLKKMIFLYIISLPIFFANKFGYLTAAISVIVLYVFASIELIAEEIEDPFGEDDNDLPLNYICNKIKTNLNEILN